MNEQSEFNLDRGLAARDAGMLLAADNHSRKHLLQVAQSAAKGIALCRPTRLCDADDVYRRLEADGYDIRILGNAAGSIFKGEEWEFTGMRKKSVRISNHARDIKIWRLRQ